MLLFLGFVTSIKWHQLCILQRLNSANSYVITQSDAADSPIQIVRFFSFFTIFRFLKILLKLKSCRIQMAFRNLSTGWHLSMKFTYHIWLLFDKNIYWFAFASGIFGSSLYEDPFGHLNEIKFVLNLQLLINSTECTVNNVCWLTV